jgi:coenzyme F420-0:L-glutamate ligase/coenzyme F420-1:gamma-L-glutamate ligase
MERPIESSPRWEAFGSDENDSIQPRAEKHRLLRERRSLRHYDAGQPTDAVLRRIFHSVAHAPSAHNRQPWRFLVVADSDLKTRLATVMGDCLTADRRRDGDSDLAIRADVERSFRRLTTAPIVIVVALTLLEMDRYPDDVRARAEWLMQSTAMAGQNLLLAAQAEGLGACWMCAPLFCEQEVKRTLSIPDDWQLQGLTTLGYPVRSAPAKTRKALSQFVFSAMPDRECRPA